MPLVRPICFEQVDVTLIGRAPATLVTELVRLEMGCHWKLIHFVVAPKMTEAVILGLAWLDKRGPAITWKDGY